MPSAVVSRLPERGLELPSPLREPRSRQECRARATDLVYSSGNGSLSGTELPHAGKLGVGLTLQQRGEAGALTAPKAVDGLLGEGIDLDGARWVTAFGIVNGHPLFLARAAIVNGFSETNVELFGEKRGLHARPACGMASMPRDIPVEIKAICELPR